MATQTDAPRYTYPELYLPLLRDYVPTAREGNTLYFPVAWWCDRLGITKRKQLEVLRGDRRYLEEGVLREVPFKLSGVWRTVLAIRKRECAWWIAGIDPQRCKPEVREHISEIQEQLITEADRLIFGAAARVPAEQRGTVEYTQRERIRMYCQDCGAPHIIVIENGAATIVRELEGSDWDRDA